MRHVATSPPTSPPTRHPSSPASSLRARAKGRSALAFGLASLLLSGCSSERPRPIRAADDLHDPNPSIRAKAVGEVGRKGEQELIPELIELLDDDDAAVRLTSGRALQDMTGRDSGYRAYAEPDELRRQVQDWRAWWLAKTGAAPRPAPAPRYVPAPAAGGATGSSDELPRPLPAQPAPPPPPGSRP